MTEDDTHPHERGTGGYLKWISGLVIAGLVTGLALYSLSHPEQVGALHKNQKQRVAESELGALANDAERRLGQLRSNVKPTALPESLQQLQTLTDNAYLNPKTRCTAYAWLTVVAFALNEYEDVSIKVKNAFKVCEGEPETRGQVHYVSALSRDGEALRIISKRPLSRELENEAIASYDLASSDNQEFAPAATLRIVLIVLRRPRSEVTESELKMISNRIPGVVAKTKNLDLVPALYQAEKAIQVRLTEMEAEEAAARAAQNATKQKPITKKKPIKKAETGLRKKSHGTHKKARSHKRHHAAAPWPGILTPYCDRSTRQGRRLAGRRDCQRMAGATFRGYSRNAPVVFFQYR